jgi:hypothetical protein
VRAAAAFGAVALRGLALAFAVASAVAGAGCGEPAATSAGEAEAADGVLAGIVVDAALRPLEQANVTATPPGGTPLATATDGDGLFRFEGLPAGSYAIEATKAHHLSAHALAQVTAGAGDEAPLVQLVLEVQSDEVPFVVQVAWDGYIGCAFSFGNLCSVPGQVGYDVIGDQSAHLFYDEFASVGRVPTLIQGEAVWEATLPTSERLKPIYGWSEPETWAQLSYLGTFFAVSQTSPTFDRVTHEMALEAAIGTENGLVVEFYSGGDETDPTGLTANQPVRLFLHSFYGYLPPDEWRFVDDGAPPPP